MPSRSSAPTFSRRPTGLMTPWGPKMDALSLYLIAQVRPPYLNKQTSPFI